MKETKGFLAEMTMFVGVFVGDVALSTRDEVEELFFVVRRIEKKGVEVESQSGKEWGFLVTSHPSFYSFPGFGFIWSFSLLVFPYQFFGVQIFGRFP